MSNPKSKNTLTNKFILLLSIFILLPLFLMVSSLLLIRMRFVLDINAVLISLIAAILLAAALIFIATLTVRNSYLEPIRKMTMGMQNLENDKSAQPQPITDSGLGGEILDLVHGYNKFLDLLKLDEKRAAALLSSEERYELVIQAANDGVWDWDLKLNHVYYSARWRFMLGFTEESIRNSPNEWLSRVHPDDIEGLKADIKAHLEGKTPLFENEHRLLHADDSYIWVLARGLALRNEQNKAYRFAGSISDFTRRKDYETRLLHDAMHDPLTRVPNREYFLENLENALGRTQRREDYHAAIILLDLDRFKLINDGFGYSAGDQLLIEITQRLKRTLRTMDTVSRFSGDEFAILLDEINGLPDAIQVTKRIHTILSQPYILENQEISPNASFGVVMLTRGYQNAEEILRDADTALNQAKANGRGRFEIFDKEMHFYTLNRLKIESELRQALKRQELKVFFQPVITAESGEIDFIEALLRWQHPEKGLIPTDEFIPVAEESGVIGMIDEFVIRTACNEARGWLDAGFKDFRVSVNISPKLLMNPELADIIHSILADTELPFENLILEITESTNVYNSGTAIQNLFDLTSIGIRVFLDDYGRVASSLEQLKRLPVHAIKISQSFIKDLPLNSDDTAIIDAIIAMAHILGMQVAAVGVDNIQQMQYLTRKKCDYLQGFLFSQPLNRTDFLRLLFEKGVNLEAKLEMNP